MGRFKDLEIPEEESKQESENLTLFVEEPLPVFPGYTKTPRYLADVKSMLELLDLKIKNQRNHRHPQAA